MGISQNILPPNRIESLSKEMVALCCQKPPHIGLGVQDLGSFPRKDHDSENPPIRGFAFRVQGSGLEAKP